MNFYEQTIEIYENVQLNSEEKQILYCQLLINLMREYTPKYNLTQLTNYILFIIVLYRDLFENSYDAALPLENLNCVKRKQVYKILNSEL
jgi:hypothetical protein